MLVGARGGDLRLLALHQLGQAARVIGVLAVSRRVVAVLGIDREEAGVEDDLPACAQRRLARRISQVDGGALELRRRHLRRDRPLPDQRVEPPVVAADAVPRAARQVGRTDRLVRFLGVLRLRGIVARRLGQDVLAAAKILGDDRARRGNRLARNLNAVGPHIGDVAVFVEALRDAHSVARGEAELARRLLLQRRGRERRVGVARDGLRLDRADGELAGRDVGTRLLRRDDLVQVEAVELLAVPVRQPGDERCAGDRRECRLDRPVFAVDERLDLALAVDDNTQRDRLDAPRRLGAGQLAPQDGGQVEADEIVERAPRSVRIDERSVDFAGLGHRREDGGLGDLVERHAGRAALGEQALLRGHPFEQVPRDRLPLAVGVGGEDDAVDRLGRVGDRLQLACLVGVQLPVHREAVVGFDRAVARRQVADMTVTRQHDVVRAKVFVDRLGLGRRFDDDKFHARLR